ncbi:MAG: CotH kinase family protein, partial [Bacteroidaceae bacterium]|nr:CotH kinase family protein [Bacteroidaceae bacterium]
MKKIFTTLLLSAAFMSGYAQDWIDVTDAYIINPRFDNNDIRTGWEGTAFGAANPRENAEHYQKTYDTYQTIAGLKAGKYRVSLNAFYRMGSADDDYWTYTNGDYSDTQYAQMYATTSVKDYVTLIAPASSAALTKSLGGAVSEVGNSWWWWGETDDETYYIPNNMEAAYYWFEAGYYLNTLECEVGDDGTLTIGIKKDYTLSGDWTCIDNWKLEQWGQAVQVTSINLSEKYLNMAMSEVHDLTASVLPTNATYQNVSWSSSDERVATVDSKGQITAVGVGTCYIVATAKDSGKKTAQCQVTVTRNNPTAENIIINEIMAANVDVYLDPSYNYGSWVEIYNPTDRSVPLGGLYVTDDPNNLKKNRLIDTYGALPANGFAILNFDHFEVWTEASYRQIDDKLDCDGGIIIISDGTKILAQQDYPEAISRCSYARTTDGGDEWGITGNPSPGTSNQANGGFATTQLEAPVVDKDAQLFTGTLQVSVNIPAKATLRYTTDGTTPTLTNGQTSRTGIFKVEETTCYRFRFFRDGDLPSPVVTRTYIYNNGNYPFPIISVVTDLDNIYSRERGVFMQGPNGRPGNGQTAKCNWNMDWDRPVAFNYITTDNECIVSQECDFSTCGGWSRGWDPKSFKLKAAKTYDLNNFFQAQLFDQKPYVKNKTLQIRNGGNDNNCRIKDGALQQIVARSGINIDYQEWQPVHVFINGSHYTVLNMREANNKHYAYSNYGIDTDEMDQFEISPDSGYVQMKGTDESFLRLVELSEQAADEDTYEEICKLLDIDEYTNYMATELYIGNWDWPQNNVKGFRDVNDGKFRFVLFDLDGALSTNTPFDTFFGKENYTFDTLHGFDYSINKNVEGQHRRAPILFVTLFKNLLQNETFRKKFIDTFCIVGGSIYQPKYVSSIVNEMSDYLSTGGYVNPWGTANSLISGFNTRNIGMVNDLKNCSYMKLSGITRQQVNLSANVDNAKITLNDIELPYTEFNGYLFAPVTLKAIAPAGYRFAGWTSESTSTQSSVFSEGSDWKYYDSGSLDDKNWTTTTYSDASWKSGNAPIGYGKNQNTETAKNLTCYYFRKSFTLNNAPASSDEYTLDFTIDDGMIVYVNGTEAGRYNMPSGNVNYNTVATSYAPNNPDTGTMTIKGSLFKRGKNVIAVEVHNNSTSSTDILWDASLSSIVQNTSDVKYVSTEAEYTLPTSGKQQLVAVFEEISADDLLAEGITPVRVNEVSAANSMYINDYFKKNDWVELYNTTAEDINIAGMYISDNAEKPQKYQVPADDVNL